MADVWFINVLYVPAEQLMKLVDAKGQYWPVGHVMHHSYAAVAPTSVLYVPALQLMYQVEPNGQYWPVGHAKHEFADV